MVVPCPPMNFVAEFQRRCPRPTSIGRASAGEADVLSMINGMPANMRNLRQGLNVGYIQLRIPEGLRVERLCLVP